MGYIPKKLPKPPQWTVKARLSEDEKQSFIEFILQAFYEEKPEKIRTSEDFFGFLRQLGSANPILRNLQVTQEDKRDDKYGIFTLTLRASPSDIKIRLKSQTSYGGPKTEDYLDRIDLKIKAAKEILRQGKSPKHMQHLKMKDLDALSAYFKEKIKTECALDHKKMGDLTTKASHTHFNRQHKKALNNLGVFMEVLSEVLNEGSEKSTDIKAKIYRRERELMSCRRPELITIRPLSVDDRDYVEVNISSPVDKLRTISSAKKDEAGVANWLSSRNQIYNRANWELLDSAETFRSASIVPHEIIYKSSISTALAFEAAKRNIMDSILPQALHRRLIADPSLGDPIEINYEMLTLLSPIHRRADKFYDPDAAQFEAMREAFNFYNGRTLEVRVGGIKRQVKFNGTYHNYGANTLRGFALEKDTNRKGFNELWDRSFAVLQTPLRQNPELSHLKELFFLMPKFNPKQELDIASLRQHLEDIYSKIEKNPQRLNAQEHKRLLDLHAKKLDNELSESHLGEYQKLLGKFQTFTDQTESLQKIANTLEAKVRKIHDELAQNRLRYFKAHQFEIEKQLHILEARKPSKDKITIDHIRTLVEFAKASKQGYDSRLRRFLPGAKKRNERNYEIQAYIQALNGFIEGAIFHKTCKSGKDRTNAAEEKYKAKRLVWLDSGKVPPIHYSPNKKRERKLFGQGMLLGPGNDLCGYNMKPAFMQVDPRDVYTKVGIGLMRKISHLQKGIDLLKVDPKLKEKIVRELGKMLSTPLSVPKERKTLAERFKTFKHLRGAVAKEGMRVVGRARHFMKKGHKV